MKYKILTTILSVLIITFSIYYWRQSTYVTSTSELDCSDIESNIRKVRINYYGFDGQIYQGEISVLAPAANYVKAIFEELLLIKFPINRIIDPDSSGEPELAYVPAAYGYSCRPIALGSARSLHSYGLAMDINHIQNPYVGIDPISNKITQIIPLDGISYINRSIERPGKPLRLGMITPEVVKIFAKYGFNQWGGYWDFPIDYMHFQISRNMSVLLSKMSPQDAEKLFNLHVEMCQRILNLKGMMSDIMVSDIATEIINNEFAGQDVNALINLYKTESDALFKKAQNIVRGIN